MSTFAELIDKAEKVIDRAADARPGEREALLAVAQGYLDAANILTGAR